MTYYESHVTIEPVDGEKLSSLKAISKVWKFRIADLLLANGAPSRIDTFCTTRSESLEDITLRTKHFVRALQNVYYKVWRYKIEIAVIDSKIEELVDLRLS